MIVLKEVDLNKPAFQKISELAKDFIRKCLTKDVDKRSSAKDLVDHEWLKSMSNKIDKDIPNEEKLDVL